MRKAIFVGLATFSSLSVVVSAAQRGGGAPAMAPAPMMHSMAAPAAPAHGPVAPGSHFASPHGPTGAHVPVAGHPSASHTGSVPAHNSHVNNPAVAHKVSTSPSTSATIPQPPINKPGTRFIPGDAFTNGSCFFSSNCYPVPGFGFDYEHFFAVHPNWNRFQHFSGVVVPGWGGGFYYPVPYYEYPQEGQEESAAAPAEQQESNIRASAPAPEETAAPSGRTFTPYTPTQPVEEYVFVKRDGTRIFAVAYSLAKDKLQYITKEGLRKTLPLDALDYDATMKSNEERGNTVTLPGAPPAAMAMAM